MITRIAVLACVLLCAGAFARGAEPVFVTTDGTAFTARQITNAAAVTVTAPLVFGGLGDTPSPTWSGRVVVLDRGTITFAEKVRKVKEAGGVAAVVANNVAGPANDATLAPETSTIPAVAVSQADGAILKTKTGLIARVGTPALPPVLPDPTGHHGEFLKSDGLNYVLEKRPEGPPAVSLSTEVAAGQRLSFTVSSHGRPPFSYQWIKDGVNIPGATAAVFVIASATAADSGNYVCQVSNDGGTAPSAPHNITIK